MASVRVTVIADDPLARSGLAALLESRDGVHVVGQAASHEPALLAQSADVVLWDLGVGPRVDLEPLREVALVSPTLVVLAGESQAADAWAAGARGLVFRESAPALIAAALHAVAAGMVVLEPELARLVMRPRATTAAVTVEALTVRERQVLTLLAEGLSNRAIAERLRISEHTAKFHVNAILGKLGAQSRAEAIAHAARLGLVVF